MNIKKGFTRNLILTAILIATFMTSVETTIITTALPTIVSNLNGLSYQSWIFAMYLLTTALTTPIYGKLSDQIGRKPVFLIGLVFFTTGSALCGLAGNMLSLILFRAIQGLGAGAIMPITFTMIADLFTYQERSKMLALNNTAWGISALLGPLMGGYIVDNLGWHWVFFINVPLGVIVFLIIFTTYHDSKLIYQKSKMDFLGIASLSILLVSVLLLFQSLSVSKINWVLMAFLMLVILLATLVLIKVEQQAIDPIVPLKLFGNQLFLVQIFTTLALSAIQIGFQTYFPMWLQSIYHASPSLAGLAVTPSPILWLLSSFLVGSLVKKFAPKYIALPLIIVMALTYLPLVFASINFPEYLFYVISGVTGFVLGIVITMNTLIAQHVVSQKDLGTASSMITLGRTLGQTIATGIFGLVFNLTIHHEISQQPTISENMVNQFISSNNHGSTMVGKNFDVLVQAVLSGMHAVFLVTLILFVLVIILNLSDKKRTIVK
ncbi:MFS transporter [Convivina intestini]|uniref:MFS transporter n=1 Tax=Convivina intestini TaxID=1505726 RepID=UPI00200FEF10|nr:MFS transporter [Convivina intestini]CAH1852571.1 Multidrug resistance protein 3 [Convivina intestini]